MKALKTHAELQAALAALPRPPQGRVRVYRGQTQDYPSMAPTGLRAGKQPHDAVWLAYLHQMALQLLQASGGSMDDFAAFVLWVRAVKQHYGPGTEFMDVTHAPGVAAWFALHKAQAVPLQAGYGDEGPFDPARDVLGVFELTRFVPHTDAPGWLYVFDVPLAETLSLDHGALYDLALAPAPFNTSPRMKVQQGCLMRADADSDGGDLRRFLLPGTPLPLAWPLAGCAEVLWPAEKMFPGVAEDAWYERFAALPIVPADSPPVPSALAPGHVLTPFTLPVPVTLVRPDADKSQFDALMACITMLPPPLAWPAAVALAQGHPALQGDAWWQRLAQALPILVEGPLQAATPPPHKGQWNFGLLFADIAATVPVQGSAGQPQGNASLDNVFIEFSPLEVPDWSSVDHGGAPVRWVRGLWLLREHPLQWAATLFVQIVPGTPMQPISPLQVRLADDGLRAQVRLRDGAGDWFALTDSPNEARPIVKALALLRDLSPAPKPSATPFMVADGRRQLVPVFPAIARLVSLAERGEATARHHRLLRCKDDEIYFGGADFGEALATVLIDDERPFGDIDPQQVRLQAERALAAAVHPG